MSAENATYTAKWTLNAEMEPFTFTSTPTSLTITSVTDRGVTSLDVPSYVTSIGSSAFSGCSGLTSVVIPDSVTSIDDYAFSDCSGLTSVTIPNSVKSIGYSAFEGCSSLKSITLSFYGVSHLGYIFGASNSDYNAKYVPASLKEVVVTGGTDIWDYAFSDCTSLTSVTIGNGVTHIGYRAFDGCSRLTSITIPDSVTSMAGSAFTGCTGLTSVNYVGDTFNWWGISFGSNGANPLYFGHNLYYNGELVTDLVIPDGVTSIELYAFWGCTSLKSVTISESVTTIGWGAFYDCSGLTSVIFEATSKWYRYESDLATSGTRLASTDLSNPSMAAKYLSSTYCAYVWRRNV